MNSVNDKQTSSQPGLWAVVVALFLVVGCASASSDGGESVRTEDNQALIAAVADQVSVDEIVWGDIDAQCVANDVVVGLGGTSKIDEQFGFSVESAANGDVLLDRFFTSTDAAVIGQAIGSCGYFDVFVRDSAEVAGLSEVEQTCIARELDDEKFGKSLASVFMDPADPSMILAETYESTFAVSLLALPGKCDLPTGVVSNWVTFRDSD